MKILSLIISQEWSIITNKLRPNYWKVGNLQTNNKLELDMWHRKVKLYACLQGRTVFAGTVSLKQARADLIQNFEQLCLGLVNFQRQGCLWIVRLLSVLVWSLELDGCRPANFQKHGHWRDGLVTHRGLEAALSGIRRLSLSWSQKHGCWQWGHPWFFRPCVLIQRSNYWRLFYNLGIWPKEQSFPFFNMENKYFYSHFPLLSSLSQTHRREHKRDCSYLYLRRYDFQLVLPLKRLI